MLTWEEDKIIYEFTNLQIFGFLESPVDLDVGGVILLVCRIFVDMEEVVGLEHQVGVEVVLEREAILAVGSVPALGVAQDIVVSKEA